MRLPAPRAARCFVEEHGGWRQGVSIAVRHSFRELRHAGPRRLLGRIVTYARRARSTPPDATVGDRTVEMTREEAAAALAGLASIPRLTFLLPDDARQRTLSDQTLASLREQYADNWDVRRLPAASLNAGLAAATGEFFAVLPAGATLPRDATTRFAIAVAGRRDAVWLYSDEAILDAGGRSIEVRIKPEFSPALLLGSPYCGSLSVYSVRAVRGIGGFRAGFDGAEEHDLMLRLAEAHPPSAVVAIPHVLCRRPRNDRPAVEAGRRAVADALRRRGLVGDPEPLPLDPPAYRLGLRPKSLRPTTVIIPTRNAFRDLKTCIDSVRAKTAHPDYEIVVVDNGSDDPETLRYLAAERSASRLRVLRDDRPFNHSEMNNSAAAGCGADYLVFLNNDVEILSDGWLESLTAAAELGPDVAAVGAKLLYPDRTVQHAGIVFRADGCPTHALRFRPADDPGGFGRGAAIGEFPGCTAALLLVRRAAFDAVGGFDAATFPTSYNDVDLCLRLGAAGGRCLLNPDVVAYHFETKTRRPSNEQAAFERLLARRRSLDSACRPEGRRTWAA